MTPFRTLAETRRYGAPAIALYRTALGRDPGPAELMEMAALVRDGTPLTVLAGRLTETDEFRRRDPAVPLTADSAAERVGLAAGLALGRGEIPLLPGLAPGAAPDDDVAYALWVAEYDTPGPVAPGSLRGERIDLAVAAGDTEIEGLARTVASLQAQSHADWTLAIVGRAHSPWAVETLDRLLADARIARHEGSLVAALAAGAGTVAGLLAAGDMLAPTALEQVAAALADDPRAAMVFSDEDRLDGPTRCAPRLKPGYSPEAPLIGQLAVYRRTLLDRVAPPPAGPAFADRLAEACAAAAGFGHVRHLPAVLIHRVRPPPIAVAPPPAPSRSGSISVIVLTKDRADLLAACTEGVLARTDPPAHELLLVDNGSTEPAALALLERLAADPRVRVLRRPDAFNFAALNNAAAREARGEILLLLNNDVEVLEPGWLAALAAQAARPEIGAVGARLLYPDGRLQHAGLLLGPEGAATHVGRWAAPADPGYLGQLAHPRDLSAVTGACLAIRRAVWDAVGGMDERLAVTWNDVDLCLRVRRAGLRVLWTPAATLVHRESASRGLERDDAAAQERFRAEQALVRQTWGDALDVDPFLNASLFATEAGPLVLCPPRTGQPGRAAGLRAPGDHVMRSP